MANLPQALGSVHHVWNSTYYTPVPPYPAHNPPNVYILNNNSGDNLSVWLPGNATGDRGAFGDPGARIDQPRAVQQALERYVTPVLCVFGFLGNVVNLIVLTRMKLRKSDGGQETGAQVGLVTLAVSDLLFCAALFPRGFLSGTQSVFTERDFWMYYQLYGTGLVTTFILTSTWITAAMATMRYVAICHPLRSRRLDRALFARLTYSLVFALSILTNLPTFWQYSVSSLDLTNSTLYVLDLGHMDHNTPQGMAYLWVRAAIGTAVPALLLIFCTYSLIRALRRSYRMRKECHVKDDSSSVRNIVTTILIVIATTFVVLVFPTELMNFFLETSDAAQAEGFLIARSVTNVLQVANFALNFIMYVVINVHFRKTLREVFCCSRAKVEQRQSCSTVRLKRFKTSMRTSLRTSFSHV